MFANPKEAEQFVDDTWNAGSMPRQALGSRTFVNRCMVEGIQWLGNGLDLQMNTGTNRRVTNWNPDSPQIVATINRITKLIHETSAATFPDRIELEIPPGDRDTGIEGAMKATVMEAVANAMVDCTGYISAAREANYRRCIDGTYCMGWDIVVNDRELKLRNGGTTTVQDQVLRAIAFPSTELTLDPLQQKPDLQDHEYVIHSRVWPVEKLRRMFGIQIDDNDLQTCGQLMGMEMYANAFTMNRLYANMALYSRTKGARVYQVHQKDEHGRFSTMLVGYKTVKGWQWINFENQQTPFGGCGLPMMMLHGYRRPDSMWSVSDVAMLKDDQDRLNLLNTFFYRILQAHAGAQWLIPKKSMKGQDSDEFKSQFNNRVGGAIEYDTGPDNKNPPPQLVRYADPPQFIQESIARGQADMREQVHRPDITQGATKTHVPNSSYQAALQGANQVLGNRIREDLTRHEWLLNVGLGTTVKLAQEGSPSILGNLQRAGLDEQDFAIVASSDPYYPVQEIRVRESSIKYESSEQKEERLWKAVQLQTVTDPMKVRMALAALDTPLDGDDKAFFQAAQKATTRIIMGEEWQPYQLGEYTGMFLTAFRRAMGGTQAVRDPEVRARLDRAINAQMMYENVATQQQAMAENPQPPEQETPQETQQEGGQEEGPSEADLGQLLQAIQAGSTQEAASAPVAA